MLAIKPGAKVLGIKPEIILALVVTKDILKSYGCDTVITEATGGTHKHGSLHYSGEALDIRTKTIPNIALDSVVKDIKVALGDDYDVLLEDRNSLNQHLHIEFQVK